MVPLARKSLRNKSQSPRSCSKKSKWLYAYVIIRSPSRQHYVIFTFIVGDQVLIGRRKFFDKMAFKFKGQPTSLLDVRTCSNKPCCSSTGGPSFGIRWTVSKNPSSVSVIISSHLKYSPSSPFLYDRIISSIIFYSLTLFLWHFLSKFWPGTGLKQSGCISFCQRLSNRSDSRHPMGINGTVNDIGW